MKRKLKIIISASAASVLAFSALAQDSPTTKTNRLDHPRDAASQARRMDRLNGAAKSSDLIGITVKNYQGEKLGKVEDIAVDLESGRIVQVIISTGGFLGMGDRLTAVPPSALHHDALNKVVHLDADKEKLKNSPKFETSKWSECCDADHLSTTYKYYNQEPAFGFVHRGDANLGSQRVQDRQRNSDNSPNTVTTRNADGTWSKDRITGENQFMIPESRLSQVQKASKLIGTPVSNLQDEKLGKVENILLDVSAGRVVAVIISSGGFLMMGDELSAIPPSALKFTADRNALQLDASKEMLTKTPHFKSNEWPDFAQPSYADGVYRAYHVQPYFTTNWTTESDITAGNIRDRDNRTVVSPDADNTRRNVRDRDDRSLTPINQGNSKSDIATTAQIRKEIIAGKNMSVNARNVKIITNNGQVTLRGPVNTAEEKSIIGEIADRIAREGHVDNQLEVKSTTNTNN